MPMPTDPLLSQQWHLVNPTFGLLDLNVAPVWNPLEGPAYSGAGVYFVVIDDGFDYLHSDLAPNYHTTLDFDYDGGDFDPFGTSGDAHGTAVMGIIGAAANGSGVVGIAHGAELIGYRTHGLISDFWLQNIRDAIAHSATNALADVVNISQGIGNDTNSEFGFGYDAARFDEIETSIGTAVNSGRGGLGTIIVKSAGNSRSADYDVNADDWTNDTRQVVVAAVDQNGFISDYSSYGAAVLVSGFGTPGEVVTTDRSGAEGYDPGEVTSTFNGTSSAAPMVSGVVGLMLEANENLGWRDVQTILAASARHVGSEIGAGLAGSEEFAWEWNAAGTWNGGGMHFSNDYGYGLVDAHAAVRLAESWALNGESAGTSGNQFTNIMDVLNTATAMPDANTTGLSFSGTATFDDIVERVTVEMTLSTTFTADMEVYLTSPDGTERLMIRDTGGGTDFSGTWTFESQGFRGERAGGTWTVRVVDDATGDVLTVSDIVIRTFGSNDSGDRYIYTDEYADYAGVSGHATTKTDSNGGFDTVNAAAVTSNSLIRLDGVAGSIAGQTASFNNIENAIGGDGNDTLIGSSAANLLHGMRGADSLDGGAGADTMQGGTGNDHYNVDSYSDVVTEIFGEGRDTIHTGLASYSIFSNTNIENLTGSSGSGQSFTGNGLDNVLTTLGGSDSLNAGGGNDTLNAGGGNDTLEGGSGTDSMVGGAGDDRYFVDSYSDVVVENAGEGTDEIRTGLASYSIFSRIHVENLTGTNAAGQTLTGNSGTNVLTGNTGNDSLLGGENNDTLRGSGGGDTLDGGSGSDRMEGGSGNDSYLVENYGDTVVEASGGGTDTITTKLLSYSIFSQTHVENLTGTETAGHNFTGNTGNNVLTGAGGHDSLNGSGGNDTLLGNGGNDTLEGGSGADSMTGGAGNDRYAVDSYSDVVVETAGGGTDTIITDLASYSIFSQTQIEHLTGNNAAGQTLTGNAGNNALTGVGGNDRLIGSGGDDTLTGNGGNDTLEGGTGTNSLTGGLGNDTYVVSSFADVLTEAAGAGTDTVQTALGAYSIFNKANIENLTSTTSASVTLTGNSLNNVLTGNTAGNDTLVASSGNDTLRGQGGNDQLSGGAGLDVFVFNTATGAGNIDTITDFVVADDTIHLENAVFTALAAGGLGAAAFHIGAAATTAAHRVIYNAATGALHYDANGAAAGGNVQIATLGAGLAMTAADFLVI